jgi:hypothetical protein
MGNCCVREDLISKESNFNLSFIKTSHINRDTLINSFISPTNDKENPQKYTSPQKINFLFSESVRVKNSNFSFKVNFKNKFLYQENNKHNIQIIESCEDHVDMKVFNTLTEETFEENFKTNCSSRNMTSYKDSNETKRKASLRTNLISNKGSVIKEIHMSDSDSMIHEKSDLIQNNFQDDSENFKILKYVEFSYENGSPNKFVKSKSFEKILNKNFSNVQNKPIMKKFRSKSNKSFNSSPNRINYFNYRNSKNKKLSFKNNKILPQKKLNLNDSFTRRERHDSFRNTRKHTKGELSQGKELAEDSHNEKKLNLVKYQYLFSDVESKHPPKRCYNSTRNVNSFRK